jgi:hypothetical protein
LEEVYVAFTSMEWRWFRQSMEGLRRKVLAKGDRSIQYRKVGFATAFYKKKSDTIYNKYMVFSIEKRWKAIRKMKNGRILYIPLRAVARILAEESKHFHNKLSPEFLSIEYN